MLFRSGMSVVYRNHRTTKLTFCIFEEYLGDKRFAHRKVSLANSLLNVLGNLVLITPRWYVVITQLLKVIPQEKKFSNDFFLTFLKYSSPTSVSKTSIEKIGHRLCLRGILGWSYSIHASAVVANFPLINYLAVYIEIPLPMIPYRVHSVAPTNHFTILTSQPTTHKCTYPAFFFTAMLTRLNTTESGRWMMEKLRQTMKFIWKVFLNWQR